MSRLIEHVRAHPVRLIVTSLAIVVASWTLAAVAIVVAFDATQSSATQICRSLNELRRQIYVASIDLGVQPTVAERFLPSEDCEALG
jgi:predicted Kef-type K+ transport protein